MKKIISSVLLIVLIFLFAFNAYAFHSSGDEGILTVKEAVEKYEKENDVKLETNRYYFLEPNGISGFQNDSGEYAYSWLYEGAEQNVPAIWWYGAENAPEPGDWVGLKFDGKIRGYNVWYADVPKNVESFIINNGNYVQDNNTSTPPLSHKTAYVYSKPLPGTPEASKIEDHNGMIYVICFENNQCTVIGSGEFIGQWYYYYGGSCYGTEPDGADDLDNCCLNAAHKGSHHDADYIESGIYGDADDDNNITVIDTTTIQQYLARNITENKINLYASDVDGDDNVTISDATVIQQCLAKQPVVHRIGKLYNFTTF